MTTACICLRFLRCPEIIGSGDFGEVYFEEYNESAVIALPE